jgi:hypothetical protein
VNLADTAVVCAIGEDGTILSALLKARTLGGTPVYGMELPDFCWNIGKTFHIHISRNDISPLTLLVDQ